MNKKQIFFNWLKLRLSNEALLWLEAKSTLLSQQPKDNDVFIAFSAAIRYSGKSALVLSPEEEAEAQTILPLWSPRGWSLDEISRVYLLLSLNSQNKKAFSTILDKLFQSADMRECATLIKAISILPHPEVHYQRAREATRTNMKNVFEALTHYNPYPAEHFNEDSWNQMILKGLFIESPLYPIIGLDRRANKNLMMMLLDYARERWAASRSISPELWRGVTPTANEDQLESLNKAIHTTDSFEQKGVALSLYAAKNKEVKGLLKPFPQLIKSIESGNLTWERLITSAKG